MRWRREERIWFRQQGSEAAPRPFTPVGALGAEERRRAGWGDAARRAAGGGGGGGGVRWGREERIWLRHQGSEAAPRTSRPAHPAALVNRAQCETQQAQCDTYVFGLCKKGRTREEQSQDDYSRKS
mgnify:CR=1 FL=1